MPENIRALIYVVLLSSGTFYVLRNTLSPYMGGLKEYKRAVVTWYAAQLSFFLISDFWIAIAFATTAAYVGNNLLKNPCGLFAFMIVSIPPFEKELSGIGGIQSLIPINIMTALALVLLAPAWVRPNDCLVSGAQGSQKGGIARTLDWGGRLLALYIALTLILTAQDSNATMTARFLVVSILTIWLPYRVLSLHATNPRVVKAIMAYVVLGVALQSVLAIFESTRSWMLYASLKQSLEATGGMGGYLARGEIGLRASAATGHPIALGYACMIGAILALSLQTQKSVTNYKSIAFICCLGGLVASISRGPWVAFAVAFIAHTILSPHASKIFGRILIGSLALTLALSFTPYLRKIIDLLPFVGSVESENISYRQQLFDISLSVLSRSPFFGVQNYMFDPMMQTLRQGQGIIDMVNTYLGLAMSSGIVGLLLYLGPFCFAINFLWRKRRHRKSDEADEASIYLALLSAILGTLVAIATTSPIVSIPTIYLMLLGITSGLAGARNSQSRKETPTART